MRLNGAGMKYYSNIHSESFDFMWKFYHELKRGYNMEILQETKASKKRNCLIAHSSDCHFWFQEIILFSSIFIRYLLQTELIFREFVHKTHWQPSGPFHSLRHFKGSVRGKESDNYFKEGL